MGYKIKNIHFCTNLDSPEMLLAFLTPVIITFIFLINDFAYGISVFISLTIGISLYLSITFIKNIAATFLKSDLSCKTPELHNI